MSFDVSGKPGRAHPSASRLNICTCDIPTKSHQLSEVNLAIGSLAFAPCHSTDGVRAHHFGSGVRLPPVESAGIEFLSIGVLLILSLDILSLAIAPLDILSLLIGSLVMLPFRMD